MHSIDLLMAQVYLYRWLAQPAEKALPYIILSYWLT